MIIADPGTRAAFHPDKMGKAELARGRHLFCGLNAFEPGQEHASHVHADQDKLYVVVEGEGDVTVGEDHRRIGPGDVALAPAGVPHGMRNPGPERLIVMVEMGPPPGSR